VFKPSTFLTYLSKIAANLQQILGIYKYFDEKIKFIWILSSKHLLFAQLCDSKFEGVPFGVAVEITTNIWNMQINSQKK